MRYNICFDWLLRAIDHVTTARLSVIRILTWFVVFFTILVIFYDKKKSDGIPIEVNLIKLPRKRSVLPGFFFFFFEDFSSLTE